MKVVFFEIGSETLRYEIEGETAYGPDQVLLRQDDNLVHGTVWDQQGFTIEKFLEPALFDQLIAGTEELIHRLVNQHDEGKAPKFKLKDYHRYVNDELHAKVITELRDGFDMGELPILVDHIESRVSEVCGVPVTSVNPKLPFHRFYIRIVRPQKSDNNPPHRDVWLDYYRNCVNIYVPISGSNERSALPIVPGSHYWSEANIERTSGGAKIKGFSYRVPSVTGSKIALKFIRPNPGRNEFVVFSPYLIHGGGSNEGATETRSSIEMRFFRK